MYTSDEIYLPNIQLHESTIHLFKKKIHTCREVVVFQWIKGLKKNKYFSNSNFTEGTTTDPYKQEWPLHVPDFTRFLKV